MWLLRAGDACGRCVLLPPLLTNRVAVWLVWSGCLHVNFMQVTDNAAASCDDCDDGGNGDDDNAFAKNQ